MAQQLMIWWVAWWVGATLLALGLIVLGVRRRRRIARTGDELTVMGLPTWRDDLLWGGLTALGGGACLGVLLLLLREGHTARGFLVSAVFGLLMLLGLLKLLKNGLAPTDVLRLDVQEPTEPPTLDSSSGEPLERLNYREAPSDF
jgi:hypothetical protein